MRDENNTELRKALGDVPPRAAHFIVTIYGDVVEPRGGTLWMGRVIDLCQAAGLSETLVRTAVSRLVSAGQLEGERVGRRSFYHLTPKARVEFAQAASILFSPPSTPDDFALLKPPEVGLPHGFVHLRPDLAIGPFRKNLGDTDQFLMRASVQQYGDDLPKFVESLWGLDPLAQRYQSVLNRFGPLLGAQADFSPQEAMVARLLLVDDYRAAILRDPMLPRAALPPDWPGWTARRLFLHLYLQLSAATDSYIRQTLRNEDGLILDGTDQLTARMARLTAEAECQPA